MKFLHLACAVAATAFLTACGGGGDSSPTTPVEPSNPGTTQPTVARADLYVGTFSEACGLSDEVKKSNAAVYESAKNQLSKTSDTVLKLERTVTFYSDAACTAPLGTLQSGNNTVTLVGQVSAALGSRTVTADKVDVVFGAINAGLNAGGTITLNGLTFPGNYFSRSLAGKNLIYTENNQLYFGKDAPLDAGGYPTTVDADSATLLTR